MKNSLEHKLGSDLCFSVSSSYNVSSFALLVQQLLFFITGFWQKNCNKLAYSRKHLSKTSKQTNQSLNFFLWVFFEPMRPFSNLEDNLGYSCTQSLLCGVLCESICHSISHNYTSMKCENANSCSIFFWHYSWFTECCVSSMLLLGRKKKKEV